MPDCVRSYQKRIDVLIQHLFNVKEKDRFGPPCITALRELLDAGVWKNSFSACQLFITCLACGISTDALLLHPEGWHPFGKSLPRIMKGVFQSDSDTSRFLRQLSSPAGPHQATLRLMSDGARELMPFFHAHARHPAMPSDLALFLRERPSPTEQRRLLVATTGPPENLPVWAILLHPLLDPTREAWRKSILVGDARAHLRQFCSVTLGAAHLCPEVLFAQQLDDRALASLRALFETNRVASLFDSRLLRAECERTAPPDAFGSLHELLAWIDRARTKAIERFQSVGMGTLRLKDAPACLEGLTVALAKAESTLLSPLLPANKGKMWFDFHATLCQPRPDALLQRFRTLGRVVSALIRASAQYAQEQGAPVAWPDPNEVVRALCPKTHASVCEYDRTPEAFLEHSLVEARKLHVQFSKELGIRPNQNIQPCWDALSALTRLLPDLPHGFFRPFMTLTEVFSGIERLQSHCRRAARHAFHDVGLFKLVAPLLFSAHRTIASLVESVAVSQLPQDPEVTPSEEQPKGLTVRPLIDALRQAFVDLSTSAAMLESPTHLQSFYEVRDRLQLHIDFTIKPSSDRSRVYVELLRCADFALDGERVVVFDADRLRLSRASGILDARAFETESGIFGLLAELAQAAEGEADQRVAQTALSRLDAALMARSLWTKLQAKGYPGRPRAIGDLAPVLPVSAAAGTADLEKRIAELRRLTADWQDCVAEVTEVAPVVSLLPPAPRALYHTGDGSEDPLRDACTPPLSLLMGTLAGSPVGRAFLPLLAARSAQLPPRDRAWGDLMQLVGWADGLITRVMDAAAPLPVLNVRPRAKEQRDAATTWAVRVTESALSWAAACLCLPPAPPSEGSPCLRVPFVCTPATTLQALRGILRLRRVGVPICLVDPAALPDALRIVLLTELDAPLTCRAPCVPHVVLLRDEEDIATEECVRVLDPHHTSPSFKEMLSPQVTALHANRAGDALKAWLPSAEVRLTTRGTEEARETGNGASIGLWDDASIEEVCHEVYTRHTRFTPAFLNRAARHGAPNQPTSRARLHVGHGFPPSRLDALLLQSLFYHAVGTSSPCPQPLPPAVLSIEIPPGYPLGPLARCFGNRAALPRVALEPSPLGDRLRALADPQPEGEVEGNPDDDGAHEEGELADEPQLDAQEDPASPSDHRVCSALHVKTPTHTAEIPYIHTPHSLRRMAQVLDCLEARQPCVLEGETGVGKTYLLQKLGSLLGVRVMIYTLNPHVSPADLAQVVSRAREAAAKNEQDVWLVLDEFNTARSVLDRCENLLLEPPPVSRGTLRVLATGNPNSDRYDVASYSPSLKPFVLRFGELDDGAKQQYVERIEEFRAVEGFEWWPVISAVQRSLVEQHSAFRPSLRDLIRLRSSLRLWQRLLPLLHRALPRDKKDPLLDDIAASDGQADATARLLALYSVYGLSFRDRKAFYRAHPSLASLGVPETHRGAPSSDIIACIQRAVFAVSCPGPDIVPTPALLDNLLALVLAAYAAENTAYTPLLLCGDAGVSKTLTISLVASRLAGGQGIPAFWKEFASYQPFRLQLSAETQPSHPAKLVRDAYAWTDYLSRTFEARRQSALVCLEELSMASPATLKSLHHVLDYPSVRGFRALPCFVTTNYTGDTRLPCDSALLNRFLCVQHAPPSLDDAQALARAFSAHLAGGQTSLLTTALLEQITRVLYRRGVDASADPEAPIRNFVLRDVVYLSRFCGSLLHEQHKTAQDELAQRFHAGFLTHCGATSHDDGAELCASVRDMLPDALQPQGLKFTLEAQRDALGSLLSPKSLLPRHAVVVCSTPRAARECLAFLREQAESPRRVSVLPLDAMREDEQAALPALLHTRAALERGDITVLLYGLALVEPLHAILNLPLARMAQGELPALGSLSFLGRHDLVPVHPSARIVLVLTPALALRMHPATLSRMARFYWPEGITQHIEEQPETNHAALAFHHPRQIMSSLLALSNNAPDNNIRLHCLQVHSGQVPALDMLPGLRHLNLHTCPRIADALGHLASRSEHERSALVGIAGVAPWRVSLLLLCLREPDLARELAHAQGRSNVWPMGTSPPRVVLFLATRAQTWIFRTLGVPVTPFDCDPILLLSAAPAPYTEAELSMGEALDAVSRWDPHRPEEVELPVPFLDLFSSQLQRALPPQLASERMVRALLANLSRGGLLYRCLRDHAQHIACCLDHAVSPAVDLEGPGPLLASKYRFLVRTVTSTVERAAHLLARLLETSWSLEGIAQALQRGGADIASSQPGRTPPPPPPPPAHLPPGIPPQSRPQALKRGPTVETSQNPTQADLASIWLDLFFHPALLPSRLLLRLFGTPAAPLTRIPATEPSRFPCLSWLDKHLIRQADSSPLNFEAFRTACIRDFPSLMRILEEPSPEISYAWARTLCDSYEDNAPFRAILEQLDPLRLFFYTREANTPALRVLACLSSAAQFSVSPSVGLEERMACCLADPAVYTDAFQVALVRDWAALQYVLAHVSGLITKGDGLQEGEEDAESDDEEYEEEEEEEEEDDDDDDDQSEQADEPDVIAVMNATSTTTTDMMQTPLPVMRVGTRAETLFHCCDRLRFLAAVFQTCPEAPSQLLRRVALLEYFDLAALRPVPPSGPRHHPRLPMHYPLLLARFGCRDACARICTEYLSLRGEAIRPEDAHLLAFAIRTAAPAYLDAASRGTTCNTPAMFSFFLHVSLLLQHVTRITNNPLLDMHSDPRASSVFNALADYLSHAAQAQPDALVQFVNYQIATFRDCDDDPWVHRLLLGRFLVSHLAARLQPGERPDHPWILPEDGKCIPSQVLLTLLRWFLITDTRTEVVPLRVFLVRLLVARIGNDLTPVQFLLQLGEWFAEHIVPQDQTADPLLALREQSPIITQYLAHPTRVPDPQLARVLTELNGHRSLRALTATWRLALAQAEQQGRPCWSGITDANYRQLYLPTMIESHLDEFRRHFRNTITTFNRCTCGYIYGIDNCGLPMEQLRCPRCGGPIGGGEHYFIHGQGGISDQAAIRSGLLDFIDNTEVMEPFAEPLHVALVRALLVVHLASQSPREMIPRLQQEVGVVAKLLVRSEDDAALFLFTLLQKHADLWWVPGTFNTPQTRRAVHDALAHRLRERLPRIDIDAELSAVKHAIWAQTLPFLCWTEARLREADARGDREALVEALPRLLPLPASSHIHDLVLPLEDRLPLLHMLLFAAPEHALHHVPAHLPALARLQRFLAAQCLGATHEQLRETSLQSLTQAAPAGLIRDGVAAWNALARHITLQFECQRGIRIDEITHDAAALHVAYVPPANGAQPSPGKLLLDQCVQAYNGEVAKLRGSLRAADAAGTEELLEPPPRSVLAASRDALLQLGDLRTSLRGVFDEARLQGPDADARAVLATWEQSAARAVAPTLGPLEIPPELSLPVAPRIPAHLAQTQELGTELRDRAQLLLCDAAAAEIDAALRLLGEMAVFVNERGARLNTEHRLVDLASAGFLIPDPLPLAPDAAEGLPSLWATARVADLEALEALLRSPLRLPRAFCQSLPSPIARRRLQAILAECPAAPRAMLGAALARIRDQITVGSFGASADTPLQELVEYDVVPFDPVAPVFLEAELTLAHLGALLGLLTRAEQSAGF